MIKAIVINQLKLKKIDEQPDLPGIPAPGEFSMGGLRNLYSDLDQPAHHSEPGRPTIDWVQDYYDRLKKLAS